MDTVFRATPVMREVERIEQPSTRAATTVLPPLYEEDFFFRLIAVSSCVNSRLCALEPTGDIVK